MAGLNNIPDKTAVELPSELKKLADFDSMGKRSKRVTDPMSTEIYPILDK